MSAEPLDPPSPAAPADDSRQVRLVRRELHSSRAVASVLTALVLILACLVLLFEVLLETVGDAPFLLDLDATAALLGGLPGSVPAPLLGAASALLVLVGGLLLLLALTPGRRARYTIADRRAAVVVDAEVVASSLAGRARTAADVAAEQVFVTISRRSVTVQIRPTSGRPVDADAVRAAVADDLERSGVAPVPPISVRVAESGVIGQ